MIVVMNDKKFVCLCRVKCIRMKICELNQICLMVNWIGKYIYVQVIFIDGSNVIVSVLINEKGFQGVISNCDVVVVIGLLIVECVKEKGVIKVVFD